MPPDQSNLPEGVSRWTAPRGPGGRKEMLLAASSDSDGPFYVREDQVSTIIEQERQQERERMLGEVEKQAEKFERLSKRREAEPFPDLAQQAKGEAIAYKTAAACLRGMKVLIEAPRCDALSSIIEQARSQERERLDLAASQERQRIEELELLLEQAQKDPTSIERGAEFAAGLEAGREQERPRVREALADPLRSLRSLADRLHDASDAERARATGAQFTRGLIEDIEAALQDPEQPEGGDASERISTNAEGAGGAGGGTHVAGPGVGESGSRPETSTLATQREIEFRDHVAVSHEPDCDDLCTCGHERFHHDDGREMGVYTNCKACGCPCKQFTAALSEGVGSGADEGWPVELTVYKRKGPTGKPTLDLPGTGRAFGFGDGDYETRRYVSAPPPQAVQGEEGRYRKALETVCSLYETACREEDPNDPESEYDENDPDGHGAVFGCFQRAEQAARAALSPDCQSTGGGRRPRFQAGPEVPDV